MAYYKIFQFDREPFSNSPDPVLFFNSRQHTQALQQLEIAIRLKRGLNVITGDVGTGKTTLSRQLIQRLSNDSDIEYFLMLDPGYTVPCDFLSAILNLFNIETSQQINDENLLKETFKNHLFSRGVDKGKIQVLLIDEGQKLSVSCIEILRELLNYETNNEKLLQIVIFAQKEFYQMLLDMENVNDRINFRYVLTPLNYFETKELIGYRLRKSGHSDSAKTLFTNLSYVAIFYFTKGYPRKIIHLCHHILLSLIIEKKQQAGVFFTRRCARRVFRPTHTKRIGHLPAMLAVSILLVSMFFFNFPDLSGDFQSDRKPETHKLSVKPDSVIADVDAIPMKTEARISETNDKRNKDLGIKASASSTEAETHPALPGILGTVKVHKNAILYKMIEFVYGSFEIRYMDGVLKANPFLDNPAFLKIGMELTFPLIDSYVDQWKKAKNTVLISEHTSFESAYYAARDFSQKKTGTIIIPSVDRADLYLVLANKAFPNCDAALTFMNEYNLSGTAKCLSDGPYGSHFESIARIVD